MALFKRCYRLSIDIDKTRKVYKDLLGDEGLKIDFDVDMSANGNFSKGNITITGLAQQDMAFLATNRNPNGTLKPSKLELEVGYPDLLSLILSGNIIEAEANFTMPDQNIRLSVMSAFQNSQINKNTSNSINGNATFRDICQITASNNKLSLKYDPTIPNKIIGDYSFRGSPAQQIQNLRQYMPDDVSIAVKNNILQVVYNSTKGARAFKLDSESGLIGDPAPTLQGCNVRMLLNPALSVNDFVDLKSRRIPQLDGRYRILELKHKGVNRGDIWESNLVMIRAR